MTAGNIEFIESPAAGHMPLREAAILLHPNDDVAIARVALPRGIVLTPGSEAAPDWPANISVQRFTSSGHKIALRSLAVGAPIRRYGQVIGFATQSIQPGDHVHSHNLAVQNFDREYQFGIDAHPANFVPESARRTFLGFRRANGQVGTRNYIAVISNVNCSAHTVREIAHHFTSERLAAYPNVDGVLAFSHLSGCGNRIGGDDQVLLQRTLSGIARHANIAAYILVGLGCESNQISEMVDNFMLRATEAPSNQPLSLTIQGAGGIRKTVSAAIEAVESILPMANAVSRTPQPISELVIALQCGGSDSWSGVTANPLLGLVADEVVRQGGSAVLAETPEIYGAEHLLTRRAVSHEVGHKLVEKVRWWERHAKQHNIEIDNNPSVGNKAGGLTTIYEKSLGAVAKGGSTPLMGVYDYAEAVTARGFTFMDTPGYDPVSVTGQVAGGCNLVLFTTGRGSVFGFKPAPSIKISTNTTTYNHMQDDMDFNAGRALEGEAMHQLATELLDLTIAVASGQPSKSEAQGVGEAEFNPWNLGGTL